MASVKSKSDLKLTSRIFGASVEDLAKLLDQGANINLRISFDQRTPLMEMARENQVDCVQFLLERGAFLDLRDIYGLTAFEKTKSFEIKNILTKAQAEGRNLASGEIKAEDDRIVSLNVNLFKAVDEGNLEAVKKVIESGAIPQAFEKDNEGEEGLGDGIMHRAVLRGDPEIIQFLVHQGAHLSHEDLYGKDAISLAPNKEFRKWLKADCDPELPMPAKVKPRTRADIKKTLEEVGDPKLLKPCAVVDFMTFDHDPGPLYSKVGGLPYMEANDVWPLCEECKNPLVYVFQINLQDQIVKSEGLITFYLCFTCMIEKDFAKDSPKVHELKFYPNPNLKKHKAQGFPVDLGDGEIEDPIMNALMVFKPGQSYPSDHLKDRSSLIPGKKKYDPRKTSYLGGYPKWIQSDETPQCHCGKKMEFIFQLNSDYEKTGLSWNDSGNIYFFQCVKHPEDLKLIMQSF